MNLIHLTNNPISELYDVKQSNNLGYKPNGLWYSPNNEWYKFHASFNKEKKYKYAYKIKLSYTTFHSKNINKVLKITDNETFDLFTRKYGFVYKIGSDPIIFILIKWKDVSKDFGGIEVIPFLKSRLIVANNDLVKKYNKKFKFIKNNDYNCRIIFWLESFDIPSGCVWNSKAIREIKYVF